MNRKLEMIVTNRDYAINKLSEFEKNRNIFEDTGLSSVQIDSMHREAERKSNNANDEFWKAFEFPLEIFDLKKNEVPGDGEVVILYDEIVKIWREVQFHETYPASQKSFCLNVFRQTHLLGIMDIDQFTGGRFRRWTRLPQLPELPNKTEE